MRSTKGGVSGCRGVCHLGDRPYFPKQVEQAIEVAHESEEGEEDAAPRPGASPELRVLEAFIAQHYLEGGLPPLLIVSHAVDKALVEALAMQSGAPRGAAWSELVEKVAMALFVIDCRRDISSPGS